MFYKLFTQRVPFLSSVLIVLLNMPVPISICVHSWSSHDVLYKAPRYMRIQPRERLWAQALVSLVPAFGQSRSHYSHKANPCETNLYRLLTTPLLLYAPYVSPGIAKCVKCYHKLTPHTDIENLGQVRYSDTLTHRASLRFLHIYTSNKPDT